MGGGVGKQRPAFELVHVGTDGRLSSSHPGVGALAIVRSLVWHSLPRVAEASLIPAAIFWLVVTLVGPGPAMLAALCWAYGSIARRSWRGQAIPGILQLATVGLTVRTAVALASGSTTLYFLQPILTTVVVAAVFLGSLSIGRPMIARLAGDFCPIAPGLADRPGTVRLFRRLTLLWACVHLVSAAMTLTLLLTMPVGTFVAIKTVASLGITLAAIGVTVTWSLRTVRQEGFAFTDTTRRALAGETAIGDLPRSAMPLDAMAV